MSNYHVYECDRCGITWRTSELPKYWSSMTINDTNKGYSPTTDADLCQSCISVVYAALQKVPTPRLAGIAGVAGNESNAEVE